MFSSRMTSEGEFQIPKKKQRVQSEDQAGLLRISRNGSKRLIPIEREVPDLAREDEDHRGQLGSHTLRQNGAEAEQDDRKKGQDGHAFRHWQQHHEGE